MAKKMPKKMRARHMRKKQGGDRDHNLPGIGPKVTSEYGNENIEGAEFALTPEALRRWEEERAKEKEERPEWEHGDDATKSG